MITTVRHHMTHMIERFNLGWAKKLVTQGHNAPLEAMIGPAIGRAVRQACSGSPTQVVHMPFYKQISHRVAGPQMASTGNPHSKATTQISSWQVLNLSCQKHALQYSAALKTQHAGMEQQVLLKRCIMHT
jgi:hypothetical protein